MTRGRKMMTDKTKRNAVRILKIVGTVIATVLAIGITSMMLYLAALGAALP